MVEIEGPRIRLRGFSVTLGNDELILQQDIAKTLAEAGLSSSEDDREAEAQNASAHPANVMIGDQTGNRYMRIVPCKGLGEEGEAKLVVKDLH